MTTDNNPAEHRQSTEASDANQPVQQLFSQSVNDGSAQYWAVHFAEPTHQSAIRAAFSFAHAMNVLTTVSPEVIAEKSVWWHEELTETSRETARHPTTQALMTATDHHPETSMAVIQSMHHHLHGALMSQQRTELKTPEAWSQYALLRFGSLHELIALASGADPETSARLGAWCAQLHALGVQRAPQLFDDARVLTPSLSPDPADTSQVDASFIDLKNSTPRLPPANAVLVAHEIAWWKQPATQAPPVFTGLPVGLRGMLASWRAARRAR